MKKLGVVPGKAAKHEKMGKKFTKTIFGTYSRKTGKFWNETFFTGRCPGTVLLKQVISSFNSDPSTFDHGRFLAKNNLNRAKSNRIFLGKKRRDRDFIWQYLDSPMAKGFLVTFLLFLISAILRKKRGSMLSQKCKFWVYPVFLKM